MKLYEQIAADISGQIRAGVLRAGDRIPSVRAACRSRRVSPSTVLQAYALLEDNGEIRTRPRSGYFVSAHWAGPPPEPKISKPPATPQTSNVSDLIVEIFNSVSDPNVVAFGSPFPCPEFFPLAKLAKALRVSSRRLTPQCLVANLTGGNGELRRLLARHYLDVGFAVQPDDIIITAGALEALNIALQVTTRRGDLVAIESPTFYACLEAIERLGLRAVEIPTDPRTGMDLAALASALQKRPIKACWVMTNFQNPVGSLMPEDNRRELVRMLGERDIPLIEDDVYSELYFGNERPRPAKAFDKKGLVLHCSSFSKCLAPGYRLGWIAPGRYYKQVQRAKLMTSLATSVPMQVGMVEYLKYGGYGHHLRNLRSLLAAQQKQMLRAIGSYFPPPVTVTRPAGGYFLWVSMPETVCSLKLYRAAMAKGIMIAPGCVFSPQQRYRHYMRLNYGAPWTPRLDNAMANLGEMIGEMSGITKTRMLAA